MALLAAALLFTACEGEPTPEEGENFPTTNQPMSFNWISAHPTSADYVGSAAIQPLNVDVNQSAGGSFAYQWYKAETFTNSGGSAIASATNAAYTPDAADIETDGSFYYAVVTRTTGGKTQTQTSNPARIRVLASAPDAPVVTVTITSENKQYVRGFGGMSNAFAIGAPARYMELEDIDTMFNPDYGLGLKILRIMIWPNPLSDVIRGQVEPQMNNQRTYLQAVKMVNKFGGYVLASPWTPLPEWKINGVVNGTAPSYLLDNYYPAYARYLASYAGEMENNGAPIYTLSIQNEPSFPASYAGCEWTSEQQRNFFKNDRVGKFTANVPGFGGGKKLESVKIMSGEPHQAVTWNNAARNDPTAHAAIDIYSFHTYGNHNNSYTMVQADNDLNRKEVWMTEWNINSGEGNYDQDSTWDFIWVFVDAIDNDIRCDSVNAFVWWYLKRFYGFIGDNSFGTINNEVTPRGYAMSHYAKYATDTIRIPATVNNHPGGGNTSDNNAQTGYPPSGANAAPPTVFVKASAFRRKPVSARSGYWENQVEVDEDSISLVIYDKRTSSGAQGQDIRVSLPDDFGAAKFAHAIISDSTGNRHAPHIIVLNADGKTADFNLPANSIVSIKFSK